MCATQATSEMVQHALLARHALIMPLKSNLATAPPLPTLPSVCALMGLLTTARIALRAAAIAQIIESLNAEPASQHVCVKPTTMVMTSSARLARHAA